VTPTIKSVSFVTNAKPKQLCQCLKGIEHAILIQKSYDG